MALITTKYGTAVLARRSAEALLHAVRFASESETPLNTFITINLNVLGIASVEATTFFQRLREKIARAWAYKRANHMPALGPLRDCHTHENPGGNMPHVHWLISIPLNYRAEFLSGLEKRLVKMTNVAELGNALHVQSIATPGTLAKYLVKGVDPCFKDYFHLAKVTDEGRVLGRRMGVSRSLGRAARAAAGWKRRRSTSP